MKVFVSRNGQRQVAYRRKEICGAAVAAISSARRIGNIWLMLLRVIPIVGMERSVYLGSWTGLNYVHIRRGLRVKLLNSLCKSHFVGLI